MLQLLAIGAAIGAHTEAVRDKLPQELGRKPVNWLLDKSRSCKPVMLGMPSLGKVPVSWLSDRSRACKLTRLDIPSGGKVPVYLHREFEMLLLRNTSQRLKEAL